MGGINIKRYIVDRIRDLVKALKIRERVRGFINKITILHKAKAEGISTTDLVNTIFDFCEMYCSVKFYPYQAQFGKRLIRSVLENDGLEITALFARQMGKSETVANTLGGLMIILPQMANMPMFVTDKRLDMFKNGLWVGVFAPSLRQSQTTYGRLRDRLQCDSAIAVLEEFNIQFNTSNGQTVSLDNGSFCNAVSASANSNIEGDSYKLILCEECQDISTFKIRKSIHPMGASYNSSIIKIGTPTTFKGDFYEAIQRNKDDFTNGKLTIRNHFEYNHVIGSKYNPKYKKYVEKEMYRMGEKSDEFRMSYGLEWILERGMFIDADTLEKTCGRTDLGRVAYDRTKPHVLGIDLAKRGDSTVITVVEPDWNNPVIQEEQESDRVGRDISYTAYKTHIKDWRQLDGDDYNTQYYEILDYLKNWNVVRIMLDATREESMTDRLRANLKNTEVIGCVFSSGFKSEMYKHLDTEVKASRCTFPLDEKTKHSREYMEFIKQMGNLVKDYRGQTMVVSHPNERGAHDDYADSWALALYGCRGGLAKSYNIEVEDTNPFLVKSSTSVYSSRNSKTARRR